MKIPLHHRVGGPYSTDTTNCHRYYWLAKISALNMHIYITLHLINYYVYDRNMIPKYTRIEPVPLQSPENQFTNCHTNSRLYSQYNW